MKLSATEKKKLQVSCSIHWWNHGKKTLDVQGTLEEVLKAKKITITKKIDLEHKHMFNYTCKFSIGSQTVVIKQRSNEEGLEEMLFKALIYTMAYLGDKSEIKCGYRGKTFNF